MPQSKERLLMAGGLLRNNLSCNEQTSIRVWMLVCLCSPQTQCTGTVRIIAPSPNKGKWALGLLDKLELVNPFFQMKQTQFEDGFSCVGK